MIIITGRIAAKMGRFHLLKEEGLAHSARSRTEDGCLSHRCYVDAEEDETLFFYEEWRDMAAVKAHFKHPDTPKIMAAIREHGAAIEGPTLLEARGLPKLSS